MILLGNNNKQPNIPMKIKGCEVNKNAKLKCPTTSMTPKVFCASSLVAFEVEGFNH
jgi:hypothetical protein